MGAKLNPDFNVDKLNLNFDVSLLLVRISEQTMIVKIQFINNKINLFKRYCYLVYISY